MGARVAVHGDRRIIAYVGAALVGHGPVPADLSAHVPSLEDALLRMLEPEPGAAVQGPTVSGPAASGPTAPTAASHDLIGGRR
jgi:hypothetical protein